MNTLAVWLMQSRVRQIVAIALLFLIPGLKLASPAIAVASVLSVGPVMALPVIASGAGLIGAVGLFMPEIGALLFQQAVVSLLAALVIGSVLRRSGSLTLTLQLLVLVALGGIAVFFVNIADPVVLWQQLLGEAARGLQQAGVALVGLDDEATLQAITDVAPFMTGVAAAMYWFGLAVTLLLGYYIFDVGTDQGHARFGRFRDLNLGRALAIALVVFALLASFLPALVWLNMALLLLLTFLLHGIALLHWLRHRNGWPVAALVVAYGLLFIPIGLNGVILMMVCVAGYVDAWFNMVRTAPDGQAG